MLNNGWWLIIKGIITKIRTYQLCLPYIYANGSGQHRLSTLWPNKNLSFRWWRWTGLLRFSRSKSWEALDFWQLASCWTAALATAESHANGVFLRRWHVVLAPAVWANLEFARANLVNQYVNHDSFQKWIFNRKVLQRIDPQCWFFHWRQTMKDEKLCWNTRWLWSFGDLCSKVRKTPMPSAAKVRLPALETAA